VPLSVSNAAGEQILGPARPRHQYRQAGRSARARQPSGRLANNAIKTNNFEFRYRQQLFFAKTQKK
jgi:hypothetical protein